VTDLVGETQDSTETIVERVREALADPRCAGIRFRYTYEPVGGPGMPVTPPAGHLNETVSKSKNLKPVEEQPGLFDLPGSTKNAPRYGVTINTYGAQASRFEAALKRVASEIHYPLIKAKSGGKVLSTSLDWPHRQADFHWKALNPDEPRRAPLGEDRDAYVNIRRATPSEADAIIKYFPVSAALGWWHSQEGVDKKKLEARENALKKLTEKLEARDAIQSELDTLIEENASSKEQSDKRAKLRTAEKAVSTAERALERADARLGLTAYGQVDGAPSNSDPARFGRVLSSLIMAEDVRVLDRLAARLDPFGTLGGEWSDVGAGTLPPQGGVRDIIAKRITGFAFVSFSQLRNLHLADADSEDNARILVTLLSLLMVVETENDTHIRAGAELKPTPQATELVMSNGTEQFVVPSSEELKSAVRDLGKGFGWPDEPYVVEATPEYLAFKKFADEHVADGGATGD